MIFQSKESILKNFHDFIVTREILFAASILQSLLVWFARSSFEERCVRKQHKKLTSSLDKNEIAFFAHIITRIECKN